MPSCPESSIIGVGPRLLRWLIAAALAAAMLCGCSSVRLAYGNGSTLAWWWLDGYLDLGAEQAPPVKQAIDRLFDWHRRTQLPDYAALLARLQQVVLENTTPEQACRWQDELNRALQPAIDRAALLAAEQVPLLREHQFQSLEKAYRKRNDEMRKDFLQPDPQRRMAASIKRTVDRAERLYGALEDDQLRVVRASLAASPFNPELWLAERQRRQRDTIETLRRLLADRADLAQRAGALRQLAGRLQRSPDPLYRAYQIELDAFNCTVAARLHNSTTPAQRETARATLKGWETDLRELSAPPPA